MQTTFVTAFMNIYDTVYQNKDLDWRFQHFRKLAQTGIQLAVFVSPDCIEYMNRILVEFPNVRVVRYVNLSETWVYQAFYKVQEQLGEPIALPNARNVEKDTKEYLLLMNAKTEYLKWAIENNPFGSTHFAWIDFNIYHIFGGKELCVHELLMGLAKRTMHPYFLTMPGCWGKEHVREEFLINDICWRFCGGFFIGSGDRVLELHSYYLRYFEQFLLEKRKLVWEVNFWAYVELVHSLSVIWYPGDHNERILEISATNMVRTLCSLSSCESVKYVYPDYGDYIPTSTGYVYHKGQHYINTRYVNYWLHPNGAYWIKDPDSYIRTRNFCSRLDDKTLEPEPFSLDGDAAAFREMRVVPESGIQCHGGNIYGLEDIRLYENTDNKVWFIATSINYSGLGRCRMIRGKYNMDLGICEDCHVLVPPDKDSWCEKNWIPIIKDGVERFIYKWSPFEVGTIKDTEHGKQLVLDLTWSHTAPMFSNVRGSTPFQQTADGLLGVVHFSYEGGPRKYFHMLVLLDRNTLMPLKYSEYFCFHENSVEFCIGFMVREGRYYFWFSNFDRDPERMSVLKEEIPLMFDFYYKV
jgi:hypothetical protein